MTSEIGPLDPLRDNWPKLSERVVIVFGGVTRTGDRRARRQIRRAFAQDCDVVWFDGWEGREHVGLTVRRHVLDEESDRRAVVIGYRGAERSLLVNRLPNAPRFVLKRVRASRLGRFGFIGVVGDHLEKIWNASGRRLCVTVAKSTRGRFAWRIVEPEVRAVANHVPFPECIVYVDDYSLPVAWNAARKVWRDCPAGGSVSVREPGARA